jgi:protein SCO1/2
MEELALAEPCCKNDSMGRYKLTKLRLSGFWAAPIMGLLLGVASAPASEITVQVVAADAGKGTFTLHGAGLTDPDADGNQTVAVGAGDAQIGYVGQTVTGDLHQSEGAWRLDNIWPADPEAVAMTDEITRRLHYDIVEEGRQVYRDVGDSLPSFALYNQDGKLVRNTALQGRRLVLDFIFTRCAQPDMCPAATYRMGQLQKALKAANVNDVTLVTITFDPLNDTPGVLRQYAEANGLDPSNFELLTGPPDEITALMEEFGILTRTVDGVLQHTSAAIVVSPQGRITYRNSGNLWTVDEIMRHLEPAAVSADTKTG